MQLAEDRNLHFAEYIIMLSWGLQFAALSLILWLLRQAFVYLFYAL
jgi:hypothetical protein